MSKYTYRPDAKSYLKLGSRAIGPLLVFFVFFCVVSLNFSGGPKWILVLLFCGPLLLLISGLLIAFLKRYASTIEIHIEDGSIKVMEKNFGKKLNRQIGSDEKFRLMKVNTLGQLTRIASSKGYTFGRFLSEEQLESILLILGRHN